MQFHEQYLDVLQNIEFGIHDAYLEYPTLSDYDVMRALEALIDHYVAEKLNRPPRMSPQSPKQTSVFEKVHDFCEWRLGRASTLRVLSDDEDADPERSPWTKSSSA